ncbi:MAG: phenylalanine--tRNA ligase subunit alpha [Ignavibacteria bacterium GWB2_35_12]|nr:MAG: phenylalanine--tRNA ligase subunit alpha [Ignavibacteria bacterium GWA2_35_8]OGU42031.1 MAG: phenylalanine--tRNA ligase subunit alpha [Ignavibacteria bacterium GWB2_35_12]OGU93249.1 MAG: phenylalanine--tRNA ligase subunit alpha [Ignavibacteria bacterium RIFOXYA2_FULL_35_10]OGV18728.1 MAG: phenylalanine--tRNA ligase subunit alpha [Ignavibacteria bacterium RIFOXYC2_FULL_35_21]
MLDEIKKIRTEVESRLSAINNSEELEKFRLDYLVKKACIQALFDRLKDVPKDEKPLVGKELNLLRSYAEEKYKTLKEKFSQKAESTPEIDLTLPGRKEFTGTHHPVLQTMREMNDIFIKMGFSIAEGPDIEDEYHNFDALNFPHDHPARDMQDTFFIESDKKLLLRTHTSPVQIRVMKGMKPPIRCIMPGRVYRNEAINARSLAEFHQIEGLYIDKHVTFAELKGTLIQFAKKIYGENSKFRFRPSFFPFTEPSAELDITCFLCGGEGCRVCKHSGWLEIAGCGMVHPNVLNECGIDPEVYSGYAFGFGIERVTMLRTGIDDIRLLYENDVRVLEQF